MNTARAHIENGAVVFDEPVALPDGMQVVVSTVNDAPPGNATRTLNVLERSDLDVELQLPEALSRIVNQHLVNLKPWRVMPREEAVARLEGLRQRYSRKYVPFARRRDNDDVACIDPARPDEIVIVHDFASEGTESRQRFDSFWDWFRAAVEDMILFE
ncbi:MAG TPA: hypothetical protein VH062_34100 [Polyangiaceae bacterium]|jgi:hypothetical protein|nr:hypothetical protein [Polyangiaceae bacterium]